MVSRAARSETGYALLAVLWITVGIAGLTLVIFAAARNAIAPSRNRISLSRASWAAAGCLAHARAVLAEALAREATRPADSTPGAWDRVNKVLRASPPPADLRCTLDARPVGARVDVNASDRGTLAQLFRHVGMAPARADSAAAAVTSRKPYVDLRQVHLVPGLEAVAVLDSVLDVEPGPISLNHAPGAVLELLPGFTEETVRQVLDARDRDAPIATFHELARLLSTDAPRALAQLPGLVVFQAGTWVITARATAGTPAVTAVVEARLMRSASRAGISHRRSWIE